LAAGIIQTDLNVTIAVYAAISIYGVNHLATRLRAPQRYDLQRRFPRTMCPKSIISNTIRTRSIADDDFEQPNQTGRAADGARHSDEWTILSESLPRGKRSAFTAAWYVAVPPDSHTTLSCRVLTRWC
jgi:hypothetical protein